MTLTSHLRPNPPNPNPITRGIGVWTIGIDEVG